MRPRIIPAEQLPAAIERLLKDAPRTINELARLTGYSCTAVTTRLYGLRNDGYAYRRSEPRPDGGLQYVWHLDQDDDAPLSVAMPVIARDPLTAALFGSAQMEAA